jgi:hypothetical protein
MNAWISLLSLAAAANLPRPNADLQAQLQRPAVEIQGFAPPSGPPPGQASRPVSDAAVFRPPRAQDFVKPQDTDASNPRVQDIDAPRPRTQGTAEAVKPQGEDTEQGRRTQEELQNQGRTIQDILNRQPGGLGQGQQRPQAPRINIQGDVRPVPNEFAADQWWGRPWGARSFWGGPWGARSFWGPRWFGGGGFGPRWFDELPPQSGQRQIGQIDQIGQIGQPGQKSFLHGGQQQNPQAPGQSLGGEGQLGQQGENLGPVLGGGVVPNVLLGEQWWGHPWGGWGNRGWFGGGPRWFGGSSWFSPLAFEEELLRHPQVAHPTGNEQKS